MRSSMLRAGLAVGALLTPAMISALALASPAGAHVTANSTNATQGGYAVVTFRVPNERDNASTTKLEINLPTDHPIASVSVKPVPGWTAEVKKTTLATPLKVHERQVSEVVSSITWTGGQVAPGQFQEFDVSLGPLPTDAEELVFKAIQTYSNGDVVRWIDVGDHDNVENPAPTLKLAKASVTSTHTADDSDHDASASSSDGTARVFAFVSLGLAVAALGLAAWAVKRSSSRPSA